MLKRIMLVAALAMSLREATGTADEPSLVVLVNRSNPVESLTRDQLRKVLLGETREWPNRQPVIVVQRDAGSSTFRKMLVSALRMNEGEYRRWQLRTEFRGEAQPRIKTLRTNDGAMRYVFNVPGAIAVVDSIVTSAAEHVRIVKIDGKLPGDRDYGLR